MYNSYIIKQVSKIVPQASIRTNLMKLSSEKYHGFAQSLVFAVSKCFLQNYLGLNGSLPGGTLKIKSKLINTKIGYFVTWKLRYGFQCS